MANTLFGDKVETAKTTVFGDASEGTVPVPIKRPNPVLAEDRAETVWHLSLDSGMPIINTSRLITDPNYLGGERFSTQELKEVGFADTLKEEWLTTKALGKVPLIGPVAPLAEHIDIMNAAKRITSNYDYTKTVSIDEQSRGLITVTPRMLQPYTHNKEVDIRLIEEYIDDISQNRTFLGDVAAGISVLPTWMLEFAMTGGLANIGKESSKKAIIKLLGKHTKTKAGQIALRAVGWTGGAITRTTLGLPGRVAAQAVERQLQVKIGLQEQEGWATSFLFAWGDVVIESASEEAGQAITSFGGKALRATKLGSKIADGLQKAWVSTTGGSLSRFNQILAKGGYSNILGEIGEERLGTMLRAITAVNDFGAGKDAGILARLAAGFKEDVKGLPAEVVILSIPTIGQSVVNRIGTKPTPVA
ncbi:MAG: hypothetical protein ACYSSI_00005, partial [Planctomycetota bacterium]